MKLRSKASPGTGVRNTHHFNLEQLDDRGMSRYEIGAEAVEIPDADARRILRMHTEIERVE